MINFNGIFGNEFIKRQLLEAIKSGEICNTYVFEGPQGVGRLKIAKAFANALVNSQTKTHPDVILLTNELYGQKESKNLLIDTVRSMKSDAYIKPYAANKKVYIIPNSETLTVEAQNSLLKLLEEPPSYCVFILIVRSNSLLLPTVLSRACVLKFLPLSVDELKLYLSQNDICNLDKLSLIANMSGGSIEKANSIIQTNVLWELRESVFKFITSLPSVQINIVYDFVMLLKKNKDFAVDIFEIILSILRDVIRMKIIGMDCTILNVDKTGLLSEFSQHTTCCSCAKAGDIVVKCKKFLDGNYNYNLLIQNFCLNIKEVF